MLEFVNSRDDFREYFTLPTVKGQSHGVKISLVGKMLKV